MSEGGRDSFLETKEEPERAITVGVSLKGEDSWPVEESLSELERLLNTAGAVVAGSVTQRLDSINPRTHIGAGKAEEIACLCKSENATLVVFDDELSPSQQTNLEKVLKGAKVIDRTALILDIFALHANSREGRLQVRLAQNQYLYPRLRGMWAHLASNRMGGGVGSRFGEGESQLEVDRRMVRNRISKIKREIADLERTRDVQRGYRKRSGVFKISLAGYTNAGKSSLLNALTSTQAYVCDQLFATLDSTTRSLRLPCGIPVLLSDTVGFIQKLPHSLVEAFKSTLDEISQSDLILHVVDASSRMRQEQIDAVMRVLDEIGASKIDSIIVFNKCDLLTDNELSALMQRNPGAMPVSALHGDGLDKLLKVIERYSSTRLVKIEALVPYDKAGKISLARKKGALLSEDYSADGITIKALVPQSLAGAFDFAADSTI